MESYTRTLVEATAAKSLIPKPPGVLANNRSMSMKVKKKRWAAPFGQRLQRPLVARHENSLSTCQVEVPSTRQLEADLQNATAGPH